MNRYFYVALAAVVVLAGSVAAILLLDLSDTGTKNQVELLLKAIGVCATVASAVFTILGGKAKAASQSTPTDRVDSGQSAFARGSSAATQDEAESLREFVAQMRRKIEELGWEQQRFIELTTTVESDGPASDETDALPRLVNLEWVERGRQGELVAANAGTIELEDIPRRFRRVAMLGEPGSGKSTLLQQMTVLELERLCRVMETPDADASPVVPLYVSLSDWQRSSMGALEFLQSALQELVGSGSYLAANFDTLLAGGRFMLLLDGLNELPRRKIQPREGRHEQPGQEAVELLRGERVGIDPRERSLRELAQKTGLRSSFVLACRSHEYLDSLDWQIVRVLPMNPVQIDRFLTAYVRGLRLDGIRGLLEQDATLMGIAANPFFLRSIVAIYEPGMRLQNRGQILDELSTKLIARELDEAGNTAEAVRRVQHTAGSIAFRMLTRGEIGSQASITRTNDDSHAITTLLATGLVVERDNRLYFLHQIVQESFAARALCDGRVRRNVAGLLTSKRSSEVIVLWSDLAPDRLQRRLGRSLRSRNLPWRRPRSMPGAALGAYQTLTSAMLFVALSIALIGLIFDLPATLPLPFGLDDVPVLLVLAPLFALRITWTVLRRHSKVIVNAGYVMAATGQPAAIVQLVSAFAVLAPLERDELARTIARFGPLAIPHLQNGLSRRRRSVRGACVVGLGELLRRNPDREDVLDVLLALVDAQDPGLTAALVTALDGCTDERVPDALVTLFSQAAESPLGSLPVVAAAKKWTTRDAGFWDNDRLERFERLAGGDQPAGRRVLVLQALGGLGVPRSEEYLASVAGDPREPPQVRNAAISGLGLAQSDEAISRLVALAEAVPLSDHPAVAQLRRIRNPASLPAMILAASSSAAVVREAAAASLGVAGRVEVLATLEALSQDDDSGVRTAAAGALASVQHAGALAALDRLTGDPASSVRAEAMRALSESYPDLAAPILMRRARDPSYRERAEVVELLGEHVGEPIERCLQELTGDPDKRVRDRAIAALTSVRATDPSPPASLSLVLRHPLRAARRRTAALLQLEGLRAMWDEEKAAGVPSNEILNTLIFRIASDADLSQRYRVVTALFNMAQLVVGFIAAFLVIVSFEVALAATIAILDVWQYVVALTVIVLLTFVRPLKTYRDSSIGWIIATLRGCVMLIFTLVGLAFVAYTWWIWVSVVALLGAIHALRYWRKEVRRRDRDIALVSERLGAMRLSLA